MRQVRKKQFIIPAKPEVLMTLKQLISKEKPNYEEIALLIKRDVSLYANVLAVINTPYFGFRERITSIPNAVSLLGLDRLYSIVEMAMLRTTLDTGERLDLFWDCSSEVATICGLLTEHIKVIPRDDAYTLGMMHESGVPLMMQNLESYQKFFDNSVSLGFDEFYKKEHETYRLDHCDVSARLAKAWGMPELICQAISDQPSFRDILADGAIDEQRKNVLCLLVLAKEISVKFRALWSLGGGEDAAMEAMQPIIEHFGISEPDFIAIKDEIIDSLELDDFGLVPK